MRHVIFIDRNIPLLAETLTSVGEIHLFDGRTLTCNDIAQSRCTAMFVRSVTQVNKELLAGTNVRFVATATAGTDHIDEHYLAGNGIAFASASGSNSNSVAEYVVFALLHWADCGEISLAGRRLGIVGFGNIGRKVARYATSILEMEVWVNDPPLLESGFIFPDYVRYTELDELCRSSNAITNHIPLVRGGNHPTENLFDEQRIGLLPRGTLFIHTSRGGVADESALVERLIAKEIAAVCDVYCNEPAVREDLVRLALIATPHIAGYSFDAKVLGAKMVAEAFSAWASIPLELEHFITQSPSNSSPIPHKSLFATLHNSRRLDDDSLGFKTTFDMLPAERPAAFDTLRKTYPVRRETLR